MSYNAIPNAVGYPDPAWLEECMPEIRRFVNDAQCDAGIYMDGDWHTITDEDSAEMIAAWKSADADLPDGLTVPVLTDVWNEMVKEEKEYFALRDAVDKFVDDITEYADTDDMTPYKSVEEAQITIDAWDSEGVEYPKGMTAEILFDEWNAMIDLIKSRREC